MAKDITVCHISDCYDQTKTRGYCNTHYQYGRKSGLIDSWDEQDNPVLPSCELDGCEASRVAKGMYCEPHEDNYTQYGYPDPHEALSSSDIPSKWNLSAKVEAADMFMKGVPIRHICEVFDTSRHNILSSVAQLAISADLESFDGEAVLRMYEAGFDTSVIADELDVRELLVLRFLANNGKRPKYDNHQADIGLFKVIDNEQSAYWLGVMFAVGHVRTDLTGFGLDLNRIDRELLEKFVEALGIDVGITEYGDIHSVSVRNYDAVTDLISHGCLPRQSHSIGSPEGVDKSVARDFIRGLVDGAGSVQSKGPYTRLRIRGTYELLEWVADELPYHTRPPRPHDTVFSIDVYGDDATALVDWLYEGSTIFLDRKHAAAKEITGV